MDCISGEEEFGRVCQPVVDKEGVHLHRSKQRQLLLLTGTSILKCVTINKTLETKLTPQHNRQNILHDPKYLPDDLLHGGGPAHVHGLAVALLHPLSAGGADQMPIFTVEYLQGRLQVLQAHWTLRNKGGIT